MIAISVAKTNHNEDSDCNKEKQNIRRIMLTSHQKCMLQLAVTIMTVNDQRMSCREGGNGRCGQQVRKMLPMEVASAQHTQMMFLKLLA